MTTRGSMFVVCLGVLASSGVEAQSACRGLDREMEAIATSCCGEDGQYCRGASGVPDVCNAACRPVFTGFYSRCRTQWEAMGTPELFENFLRSCKRPRPCERINYAAASSGGSVAASHTQANYDVTEAIDGMLAPYDNGWAYGGGATRDSPRTAVFT
eukprot:COSAG02_NODE_21089_length_802_cov_19.630156_1_plen_156_part_01